MHLCVRECVCMGINIIFTESLKFVLNICSHYSSGLLHECMSNIQSMCSAEGRGNMCSICWTDQYLLILTPDCKAIFQTLGSSPKRGTHSQSLCVHFMKTCVSITINSCLYCSHCMDKKSLNLWSLQNIEACIHKRTQSRVHGQLCVPVKASCQACSRTPFITSC